MHANYDLNMPMELNIIMTLNFTANNNKTLQEI